MTTRCLEALLINPPKLIVDSWVFFLNVRFQIVPFCTLSQSVQASKDRFGFFRFLIQFLILHSCQVILRFRLRFQVTDGTEIVVFELLGFTETANADKLAHTDFE